MAVKLDAGVGALGDIEFEMDFDIGEFLLGEEIGCPSLGAVVPDALAVLGEEFLGILRIELDAGDLGPIAVRFLPRAQVAGQQLDVLGLADADGGKENEEHDADPRWGGLVAY